MKNPFEFSVDGILKQFQSTISNLEACAKQQELKARNASTAAEKLRKRALVAQAEADRAKAASVKIQALIG